MLLDVEKKCCLILCALPLFSTSPLLAATDNKASVYTKVETLTYSENLSINAWLDDLHAPNPGLGEYAMTRNAAEVGIGWNGFSFSGFTRRDYYFHFSNDTFDLVYKDKNHINIPQDRSYTILLDVAHVNIHGEKIAYEFSPIPNVTTKLTFGVFTADDLLFGSIRGFLGTKNKKIRGDLALDYNYTKDVVLDRDLTPPGEGRGRSLDVAATWQVRDNLSFRMNVEDLYGVIHWRQAPFTEATITTVRTYTDASGNSHRQPTISGTEYFRTILQRLPKHSNFSFDYRLINTISLGAEYDRYGDLGFKRLSGRYHLGDWLTIGLGYDFDAKAPRLDLTSKYLTLVLSADSSNDQAAKFVNASVGLKAVF